MAPIPTPHGVKILAPVSASQSEILSTDALEFYATLHREYNPRRLELLAQRARNQQAIDRDEMPGFLPETQSIREGNWRVEPVPTELQDRRVEITGPVDRNMFINAPKSGANC